MIRLQECPICGNPIQPVSDSSPSFAPFCSRRCKEIDFFRWCDGKYAIVEPLDPASLPEITQGESDDEEN